MNPQDDPLAFMQFLATRKRTPFVILTENYGEALHRIRLAIHEISRADFSLMLGDENLFTDTSVELVLYTDDPKIIEYVQNLT